jgi:hypothetical protein
MDTSGSAKYLGNFDMEDVDGLPLLKPFTPLHESVVWLDENVTQPWRGEGILWNVRFCNAHH